METNFNLGSLKIVYSPLMEYFKQIQNNISDNLILVRDEKKVATNYEYIDTLDKVQKSLKMIGLSGVVNVLSLVQEVSKDLKSVKFDTNKSIHVWEELQNTLSLLEGYLKQLLEGSLDEPTKLFSQYEKLANTAQKTVSIKDLFTPKLDLNNDKLQNELRVGQIINASNKEVLLETVKKEHNQIQQSLVVMFNGIDKGGVFEQEEKANHHGACKKIYETLSALQEQKLSKTYYVLFGIQKLLVCTATPVFNGSFSGLVGEHGKELKFNLAKIEKGVKGLLDALSNLENGDKTGSLKVEEDLVKENLYFLINIINENSSLKEMPVFKELTEYFNYSFYENQLKNTHLKVNFSHAQPEQSSQIERLLLEIKEELVLLTSKSNNEDFFTQHINKFYVLNYKLNELIIAEEQSFKNFSNTLLSTIDKLKNKKVKFTEVLEKELSLAVVLLEYAVNLIIKKNPSQEEKSQFESQLLLEVQRLNSAVAGNDLSLIPVPVLDMKSKYEEEKKALLKIFEEVSRELTLAEEILDNVLRYDDAEEEELNTVFGKLNTIKGIFSVLGNKKLSEIVEEVKNVWKQVQNKGLASVDKNLLSHSIAWLSGISLFVKASENNNITEAKELEMKVVSKYNQFFGKEDVHQPVENVTTPVTTVATPVHTHTPVEEIQPTIEVHKEVTEVNKVNEEVSELVLPTLPVLPELVNEKIDDVVVEKAHEIHIDKTVSHRAELLLAENKEEVMLEDHANDPELLEVFLEEMDAVQENFVRDFEALEKDLTNHEALANVRRGYHTLKGSGRMVGLTNLGELAWTVEQELNRWLNLNVPTTSELLSGVKHVATKFKGWTHELKEHDVAHINLAKEQKDFLSMISTHEEIHGIEDSVQTFEKSPETSQEEKKALSVNNHIDFELPSVSHHDNIQPDAKDVKETNEVKSDVTSVTNVTGVSDVNHIISEKEKEKEEQHSNLHNEKEHQQEEISIDFGDFGFGNEEENVETHNEELQPVEEVKEEPKETFEMPQLENHIELQNELPKLEVENTHTTHNEGHMEEHKEETHSHKIENVEIEDPTKEPTININGQEILVSLYELFVDESSKHLEELRGFVHDEEHVKNVAISHDFMRHAHTLGSIGQTMNLQHFANLASKIEFVSNIALEKSKLLSKPEMVILKHAVDNLDMYRNVDSSQLDLTHYEELMNNLEDLQTELSKDEYVEENIMNESQHKEHASLSNEKVSESFQEMADKLSEELKNAVRQTVEKLAENVTQLQEELKGLKENGQSSTINSDELVTQVMSKVESIIETKYSKLLDELSKNNQLADSKQLLNKVDELSSQLEQVKESQSNIEKSHKEGADAIRKDLRSLAHMLKKKSNESNQELFGNEVNKEESLEQETNKGVEEHSLDLENFSDLEQATEFFISEEEAQDLENHFELISVPEVENNQHVPQNTETAIKIHLNLDVLSEDPYIKAIFEQHVSNVEDEFDPDIYEISKQEVDEMFIKIEELLDNVTQDHLNIEDNNSLKRYLHTLKGSVRMAGANKMGTIAHRLESVLDYTENHNISLFKVKELVEQEMTKLNFLKNNGTAPLTKEKELWLDNISESHHVEDKEISVIPEDKVIHHTQNSSVTTPIKKEETQYIRVASGILDALINEAGEVRLSRTTLEGTLDNNRKSLDDLKVSSQKLARILKEVEVQAESQITARKDQLFETGKDFDPLEFDRFTRLQELTRFMNEAVADVKDTVDFMEGLYRVQENTIIQQSIVTNNMLDSLMKVRLIAVDTISDRLYKITRNTAKEMNKRVSLEIIGEETEMDRLVLDRIQSPLEHLLRNCIAHGIEEPEARTKVGKTAIGQIKIDIKQDANYIIMKVSDDGAGINLQKVEALAYEKGLITSKGNSKEELIELIFKPGFSTANTVSQIAGRGVGMDVVKNEIFALGGSIKTETEDGKGTEFTIVLPVAVATNQAMLTEISGKLIAIPAILVEQVISLKKANIERAYEEGKIVYNNKEYPIYYLGHLMGLLPYDKYPEMKSYNTLILISYLDQSMVVHIDQLETTDEILIKPIGQYLGKINGLLGATLLGDGRQGVVVNPVLLKEHFNKYIKSNIESVHDNHTQQEVIKKSDVLTVMVVDDSITVRRATSKVLEKYGYNIILAKDGEDALEQLQISIPDIILSDIEMPVMDGFEFVKNLKNIDKYKKIPVIMITSRTADKHKNYAYSLGVDRFLGKPYQEDELINNIKELVAIH